MKTGKLALPGWMLINEESGQVRLWTQPIGRTDERPTTALTLSLTRRMMDTGRNRYNSCYNGVCCARANSNPYSAPTNPYFPTGQTYNNNPNSYYPGNQYGNNPYNGYNYPANGYDKPDPTIIVINASPTTGSAGNPSYPYNNNNYYNGYNPNNNNGYNPYINGYSPNNNNGYNPYTNNNPNNNNNGYNPYSNGYNPNNNNGYNPYSNNNPNNNNNGYNPYSNGYNPNNNNNNGYNPYSNGYNPNNNNGYNLNNNNNGYNPYSNGYNPNNNNGYNPYSNGYNPKNNNGYNPYSNGYNPNNNNGYNPYSNGYNPNNNNDYNPYSNGYNPNNNNGYNPYSNGYNPNNNNGYNPYSNGYNPNNNNGYNPYSNGYNPNNNNGYNPYSNGNNPYSNNYNGNVNGGTNNYPPSGTGSMGIDCSTVSMAQDQSACNSMQGQCSNPMVAQTCRQMCCSTQYGSVSRAIVASPFIDFSPHKHERYSQAEIAPQRVCPRRPTNRRIALERANVNQQQNNPDPQIALDPTFPHIVAGNNQANDQNGNTSGSIMDEEQLRERLINIEEPNAANELNLEDEHRLLDQGFGNRTLNGEELRAGNRGDRADIRQNERAENARLQNEENFITSTPISPIRASRNQYNLHARNQGAPRASRPRDARGRFLRMPSNLQEGNFANQNANINPVHHTQTQQNLNTNQAHQSNFGQGGSSNEAGREGVTHHQQARANHSHASTQSQQQFGFQAPMQQQPQFGFQAPVQQQPQLAPGQQQLQFGFHASVQRQQQFGWQPPVQQQAQFGMHPIFPIPSYGYQIPAQNPGQFFSNPGQGTILPQESQHPNFAGTQIPRQQTLQQFGNQPAVMQQQVQHPRPAQPTGLSGIECAMILDRLPDIKGNEGSDSIRTFFKKYTEYTSEWPNKKRVTSLESKLSGRAERAYNAALVNEPFLYDNIKRSMLRQLEDTDCREMGAFDDLMNGITRKPNENLDDLADRISSLVRRAYPGLTRNLADEYSIKHLIRSLNNAELALSLELHRRSGMTYDEFVALASRAETTQKAARRGYTERLRQNQSRTFQNERYFATNSNFQSTSRPVVCFNCNEPGHVSLNCNKPRANRNGPDFGSASRNQPPTSTGANRAFLNTRMGTNPAGRSQNFLKQNCIRMDEEVRPDATVAGVKLEPKVIDFLKSELSTDKAESESPGEKPGLVGKMITTEIEVLGNKTTAMLDGGAQISLIFGKFFYDLVISGKLSLQNAGVKRVSTRVSDVNGKELECFGAVLLPVSRKGCNTTNVRFHITSAPFGFDILVGTNALNSFGFCLYDIPNKVMINFEEISQTRKNHVSLIYQTTLKPLSIKQTELHVGSEWNDKDVILTALVDENPCRVEPMVGTVQNGRLIASVANLSTKTVEIEEKTVIGEMQPLCSFGEADDMLSASMTEFGAKVQGAEETQEELNKSQIGEIPEEELAILKKLLGEFDGIFALHENELTQTDRVEHTIDTGDAKPVKSRFRPVPYAYREKVASMIKDYLGRGLIRQSFSPWASPIVIVPKRDGTLRFCVDYRGLNAVTTKDAFPLPNIDNTLLALGGKKIFSVIDFMAGYWQIRMEPNSVEKTAFATEFGLHEFKVLPFGLCNAVATYQRFMTRLFGEMVNDFIFIYIDDILVASGSWEEHWIHLKKTFERIREAGLKLKISKCHFAASEIPFLGHVLTREGIKMDLDKVKPVMDLPTPSTKKELHSLLGFFTYYRKYIFGFGTLAAPLFQLLKKDAKFKIGESELGAIELLKKKISEQAVLWFPNFKAAVEDPKRQFVMLTDASKIGIAAILCQPDEVGHLRPIYFASRQCNRHESRYCPTELEALAIRFGTKKYAQFITMVPTRVITDHRALVSMFKSKNETGNSRVDKWLLTMNSRFILQVEYQPGKKNIIADLLSRSGALASKKVTDESSIPPANEIAHIGEIREGDEPDSEGEIVGEQRKEWVLKTKEGELGFIYEFLESKTVPKEPKEQQKLMSSLHKFALIEGLLYRHGEDGKAHLFVPRPFREKMIRERHSGTCAGHLSGKKIFKQLAEGYFWPNMYGDCIRAAFCCRVCAHARKPRANEPPLNVVKTSEPLELVCIDILSIGPANSSNHYILVAVDHFTKYLVANAIPNKSAETVAKNFVKNFILVLGTPKRLHSDKGKEFVNETLTEIASTLKIERSTTAGYDPQANGVTERVNQTIIGMLRRSTTSAWEWDDRLPYIVFAYNTTPSETTGFSPHYLMFGKPANFPLEKEISLLKNPLYTVDQDTYIQLFRESLHQLIEEARKNSEVARRKMKERYDAQPKVTAAKFGIGDRVMIIVPGAHARSPHRKILWNHFGPFVVKQITKSAGIVVPADKLNAEPLTVPLERLVRVPPGIPNVCTMPKGKNPYKNILNGLISAAALIDRESSGMVGENFEQKGSKIEAERTNCGKVGQLRAIDLFSDRGEDEQMDADGEQETERKGKAADVLSLGSEDGENGENETEEKRSAPNSTLWEVTCAGENHKKCTPLVVADLDAVLDRSGIGIKAIDNPLKALMTTFLLKSDAVVSASAGKKLISLILSADAGWEMATYCGAREDDVKSGAFPSEKDVEDTLREWLDHCHVAREEVKKSGFGPFAMEIPEALITLPEAEREGMRKVFESVPFSLERVRSMIVFKRPNFVTEARVLLGDSNALQLKKLWAKSAFVGVQEGPIAEVIRNFDEVVLASTVRWLIVMVGKDSLLSGETVDGMMEKVKRLRQLCARFPHVKTFWLLPPFINDKKSESEEFGARMRALFRKSKGIELVATTEEGRSVLEIWRYGKSFNSEHVTHSGWMTEKGLSTLKAWITSMVADFPGDRELGIRAIKSRVVRVDGARGGGPGDPFQSRHFAGIRGEGRGGFAPSGGLARAGTGHRPAQLSQGSATPRFQPYPSARGRPFRPHRRNESGDRR
uniref:RNA-directed DNA polymerase n=1 Tax=Globodera rostochiensis TaxID=31243 RepID=A0A914HPD7_GLORO